MESEDIKNCLGFLGFYFAYVIFVKEIYIYII